MLESTEAFNRLANGKSWRQLDFQTQQQIRLTAILEQAYARYGDTLADTTQSRHNQFIASLKNVQLALGQAFLPIYNAVLPPLTAFMNKLARVISYISAFTTALFGKPTQAKQQTNAIKEQSGAISGLSNSLSDTSKNLNKTATSAKKAKKEIGGLIGGLDEINNLSVTETAGTSGSSDSSTPSTSTPTTGGLGNLDTIDMGQAIDTSGLEKKAEKIREIFDRIKKIISDNKNTIIAICAGLMAGLSVILVSKWGTIASSFATHFPRLTKVFKLLGKLANPLGLLKKGLMALAGANPIVLGIAVVIGVVVGALVDLWKNNEDFRKKVVKTWKAIKDALEPWIEGLCIIFKTLANIVGTVLGVAFKILWGIIKSIVQVFAEESLDELEDLAPILKDLGEKFKEFAKNVEKGWEKVKKYFGELNKVFENEGFLAGAGKLLLDVGKFIAQGLLDGIVWVLSGIANFLADKIFKPIVDGIKKLFDIHSPSRVMIEIGKFIIQGLKNGMLALIKKLPNDVVKKLKTLSTKMLNFFKKLKKDIEKKWKSIKNAVKDFVINIGSKVDDFKKKAKDKWEETKKWINNKILDIAFKIYDFKKATQDKWNEVKTWIKSKILDIVFKIADFYKDVKDKWNDTKTWIKNQILDVAVKVGSIYEKAKESFDIAKNSVKTWILDLAVKVGSFYQKALDAYNLAKTSVKTWVLEMAVKVGSFYTKALESYNTAKNSVKSWILNMAVSVGSFYSKALESYNTAKNSVKNWLLSVSVSVGSFYSKAYESYNNAKNSVKNWILNVAVSVSSFYTKAKTSYDTAKNSIKSWVFDVGVSVGSFYSKLVDAYNTAKKNIASWAFSVALKITSSTSSIKSTVNSLIDSINKNVIAKLKFNALGVSFSVPPIPKLAKGGIVDSATLAVVGEAGKEAVMPLENNTGWITDLAGKITSRMGNTGSGEVYNGDVIIKLDGNTVFRDSVVSILRQMKRQGITI